MEETAVCGDLGVPANQKPGIKIFMFIAGEAF
jgi:hypothetical protein